MHPIPLSEEVWATGFQTLGCSAEQFTPVFFATEPETMKTYRDEAEKKPEGEGSASRRRLCASVTSAASRPETHSGSRPPRFEKRSQ